MHVITDEVLSLFIYFSNKNIVTILTSIVTKFTSIVTTLTSISKNVLLVFVDLLQMKLRTMM